ncbi:MAG: hypothetical protein AB8B73_02355 [Ekhidna sp.]
MRYINKIIVLSLVMVMFSCTDEDTFPYQYDEIVANQGAFVRLQQTVSAEVDISDIAGSSIAVDIQEWDVEDGGLLQDVVFTMEFIDNTPGNGTNNVAAVEVETVPAASFTADPETGLPNYSFSRTAPQAMALLGLTTADLDGGDVFRLEWTLNLTNGKSFNRNNQSSSLPAWDFYSSPFLVDATVICSVDPTFATGTYTLTQVTAGAFGGVFEADLTVELALDPDVSTRRSFDAVYLPQFNIGNGPATFAFDLVCGRLVGVDNQGSGLQCSAGILFGPAETPGSYDVSDDSVMTLTFNEDKTGDCGAGADVTWTLTRQ